LEILKGRDVLRDLGINVRAINIKVILKKLGVRLWTEFIMLRIGST
jgi:hypothetical protein